MLTLLIVAMAALVVGVVVGWVASASRVARAVAERDSARAERERSERAVIEARRRAEEAQQARAAADALLANQRQAEETFTAGHASHSRRPVQSRGRPGGRRDLAIHVLVAGARSAGGGLAITLGER